MVMPVSVVKLSLKTVYHAKQVFLEHNVPHVMLLCKPIWKRIIVLFVRTTKGFGC